MRTLRLLILLPVVAVGCSDPVRPSVATDLGTVVDARADDAPDAAATDAPTVDATDAMDAARDASSDIPSDLSSDIPSDLPSDVPSDLSSDIPSDLSSDIPSDLTSDDAPSDAAALDDSGLGAWLPLGDGTCGARARRVAALPGNHVDPDAGPIAWLTNPPSSGDHFGSWARWGAWPDLARGNWVHNLEHGGVAFLYRCETAPCTTTRDALVAAMNALPADPACTPTDAEPARVRVVITNDALIATPIAAAAWGAVYEASCVDAPSLRQFFTMFSGHAPEDFCFEGQVP